MAEDGDDPKVEKLKVWLNFSVVFSGIVGVVLIFWVTIAKYAAAADVAAVLGSVVGVVGTVVAAYFGISTAAASKNKAEKELDNVKGLARQAVSAHPATRARPAVTTEQAMTKLAEYLERHP